MPKSYNEIPAKDNMNVNNQTEDITEPEEVVKKPLTKVVNETPVKVNRSLFGRLIHGILGPDGLPSIGTYVNDEIIKPAVKNIVYDAITSGLSRALNLDRNGYRPPNHTDSRNAYRPDVNYSKNSSMYARNAPAEERKVIRPGRYGVDEYVIAERYDAAQVITMLTKNADLYGAVSVADYYDLIDVESIFTDNSYGWTGEEIYRASIVPVRGGYIIKFPPVDVI